MNDRLSRYHDLMTNDLPRRELGLSGGQGHLLLMMFVGLLLRLLVLEHVKLCLLLQLPVLLRFPWQDEMLRGRIVKR